MVLLVLGSLSNAVGFQAVQSSNQNTINNKVNQKELLFQTIIDITNNKEIHRIIFKSQMMNGKFLNSDVKLSTPITKQQLRQMFLIGLILSKVISKSRMQSMVQQYQVVNPEIQQEISTVIEKDASINREASQLKTSECDCENEQAAFWHFPILCTFLLYIGASGLIMVYFGPFHIIGMLIVGICLSLGTILDCNWP